MRAGLFDLYSRKHFTLLASILCVLMLITIALCFIINYHFQEQEINASNQAFLEQEISQIDELLNQVDKSMLIWIMDNTNLMQYMQNEFTTISAGKKYQIIRALQNSIINIKGIHNCIYTVHLYNITTAEILTESGVFQLSEMKQMVDKPISVFNTGLPSYTKCDISSAYLSEHPVTTQTIAVTRNYPVHSRIFTKGNVTVYIKLSNIYTTLSPLLSREGSALRIYQGDNELTTFSNNWDIDEAGEAIDLAKMHFENSKSSSHVLQNKRYYTFTSKYNGWTYIMGIPVQPGLLFLERVRNFLIGIILIYTLLVACLLFISGRNTYMKANRLALLVNTSLGQSNGERQNIMAYLEGAFTKIIDENRSMHEDLSKYRPLQIGKLLNDLLQSSQNLNYDWIFKNLEHLGIKFYNGGYAVMVVEHIDGAEAMPWYQTFLYLLDTLTPPEIRTAQLDQLNGCVAIIVSFSTTDIDHNTKLLHMFADELMYAAEKQGLHLYSSISNVYLHPFGVPASYKAASDAIKYHMFCPTQKVLSYIDLLKVSETSPAWEKRMNDVLGSLRRGDQEELHFAIENFFSVLFSDNTTTPLQHVALLELLSSAIRIALELGISPVEIYKKDPFSVIELSHHTSSELISSVNDLFDYIAVEIKDKRNRSSSSVLGMHIIKIINESYNDPNLSLSQIGQLLSISESYVSRIIKDYIGINFQDYLSQIRIEHAKILLSEKNNSVNEVGQKVGYLSNHSFIRTFKKVEGISPGQWRNRIS